MVAVRLPEVPVMVKGYCPTTAELLVVSVRILIPEVGFALHVAVTPAGRPDVTARLTLPVNPYCGFT